MIHFLPFRAGHLRYLRPQPEQREDLETLVRSGQAHQFEMPMALSAWAGLYCIGAGGLVPMRPHRAVAWLLLSDRAAPYMLPLARKMRRLVEASPYKRVEVAVAAKHDKGHRFARIMGAVLETPEPMKFHGFDGGDEMMYAMLRKAP